MFPKGYTEVESLPESLEIRNPANPGELWSGTVVTSEVKDDVLSVDIRLDASGAPVGTHVFNVRFVPPSGECRFHFRRNVAVKGGVAHVDFPLALNDERGAWKVVAEDAFTGLRAERAVVVE